MKILRIIPSVNPRGGGPIEGVRQITPLLAGLGHETEVVSLDCQADPWLKDFPTVVHGLGPGWSSYRYAPRLIPWLRIHAREYDVVIVHGLWQYTSFGTWQALRGSKTPYFVYTHGMLDPWFKRAYPFKHLKKCLYWPWAERRVLRDAHAVLFTSEEERRQAGTSFSSYRCREAVINYGTSMPFGDPAALRHRFLESYPALAGKKLLLFLSRIHPKKGCDLLIKAFAQVVSTDPRLHLVMAGPNDSGWQADLECLAQKLGVADRVTWTGMLSGESKWGAFYAADAFVLPSHQENFGIAVAEALACGLPVLISDKINIWREIIADGAGLVAEDTEAGIARLLQDWLALTPNARDTMRRQAFHCFHGHFKIETASESLVKTLSTYLTEDIAYEPPSLRLGKLPCINQILFAGGLIVTASSALTTAAAAHIPEIMKLLDPIFDGVVNNSLGLGPVTGTGALAVLAGAGLSWAEKRGWWPRSGF
jgi:glycosyltransferase involved in cell wall biosynthesis